MSEGMVRCGIGLRSEDQAEDEDLNDGRDTKDQGHGGLGFGNKPPGFGHILVAESRKHLSKTGTLHIADFIQGTVLYRKTH